MAVFVVPALQTRDSIEDIWGPRTPYKDEWPTRVDKACDEEPDNWVQSACVLCSNGCGLDIGVKNGKIVGVRGRATDRVNKGRWRAVHREDRLMHPLIRKNGKLERASWDEAMDLIVAKTKHLQEELTNHSIAFYTTGQLFLEEYYALAMVGKAGLHTLHMDGNTRLCTATAATAMRESFGSDGQPGSYRDIDYTECIFMVGHNMAATQTVLWSRILDRLEGPFPPNLTVVDPRLSESARKATLHLAPKVGTNLALLNGIQHLMFKNGWTDTDFLSRHVIGLEDLKATVAEYDPQTVSNITGIPIPDLEEAARLLGTGILQMNGQPTAQNNREAGCDGEYPGFRNHQNPAHMAELARLWNIDPIQVPHWNEPTHIMNLLNYMEAGSVKMFWISCTNPLVSLPNLPRVRSILTQPDLFVVCQDIYMTETAAIADVVLPAAQWGEKTGCFTNVDRTVHISHKAVDPPGECKSDLDIFLDYARRMEFKDKDGNDLIPYTTPEQVFEAWKKMSAGRPCDYTGLTYDRLTGGSGIQWPCNEANPHGTERLYADNVFFTDVEHCESFGHDLETGAPYTKDEYNRLNPAGRAILKACHYSPPLEEPDDEFPLRLSTGRNVYHFHTRTKTGRSPLQTKCPEPEVRVSEEDAARAGVEDGAMVVVRSRRGAVEMKCRVGRMTRPGHVFMPFHFGYWDSTDGRARAANELTIDRWDPVSKQPLFKSGAVRIEKIPSGQATPYIREQQTTAEKAASQKPSNTTSPSPRLQRQLELFLGETYECTLQLTQIYTTLITRLLPHDQEVEGGLRILTSIANAMTERLSPLVGRLGENKQRGRHRAHVLREALFPKEEGVKEGKDKGEVEKSPSVAYEVLETLQGLAVYLGHVQSSLEALEPVARAMWDGEFDEAVGFGLTCVRRQMAWVRVQIRTRSPQTLLVPIVPS
ncbi:hypothetical protein GE09DRAFT_1170103 [Coniochaeta sp. 2T2.1]|nr:hypothetical protein GE09DRAFT_1170103 [Coniochaeta sp. 2T2.1]